VLAVADGHGSAAYTRSHLGARFAVDAFTESAAQFLRLAGPRGNASAPSLSWLMHHAQHEVPRRLVSSWREKVLGHWSRHHDESEPAPTDDQKVLRYGTTLLGAVVTPELFAAWQLGDGELTVIGDDGAAELPLAPAEAELGDETESLCSHAAWRLVRVHWSPIVDPARTPRLIALSTDGLSKSFASDEGFTQFMTGLDGRLGDEGTDDVRSVLPQWLTRAAQHSGDDTTLVAGRRPALQPDTEGRRRQP
jgi:serine/threonine protein phosphatase PrpC